MLPDKYNCCGCTACANICKFNAIKMKEDKEGFLYPEIDNKKCVNCRTCEKICPMINRKNRTKEIKNIYASYIDDNEKLFKSASGGIATAISEYFIKNGGIVFGVEYTHDFKKALYTKIDHISDLDRIKGSKYIQSDKKSIYCEAKKELENGKNVLFIGLPCEVAGLKNFLIKNYENLYTVALICMGPTSPKVGEQYIEYLEKKIKSKIESFNLRYKGNGWGAPNYVKAVFQNGKELIKPFNETQYGHAFSIFSRPSCLHCNFKLDNTFADMTIGDYWGVSKKEKIYNGQGVSIMIIHNEKMNNIIEKLDNIVKEKIKYENAIKNNEMLVVSRHNEEKRRKKYSKNFINKGLIYADRKDIQIKAVLKKFIPKKFLKIIKNRRK